MKTKLLSLLLVIITIKSFAQIDFEKGYFIDLKNQKTDCLIRNHDWKNNPVEFEYKLSEGDILQRASVSGIREFGIANQSKYLGAYIKIDRTEAVLGYLQGK